jgi:hypothetical protein
MVQLIGMEGRSFKGTFSSLVPKHVLVSSTRVVLIAFVCRVLRLIIGALGLSVAGEGLKELASGQAGRDG